MTWRKRWPSGLPVVVGVVGGGFVGVWVGPPPLWGRVRDTDLDKGGGLTGLVGGGVLLSHTLPSAVPSALVGLATGFGMRPGVSPPL